MKILFLFVNYLSDGGGGNQPLGVASLLTSLKEKFDVDFLDTSFMLRNPIEKNSYTGHIKIGDAEKKRQSLDECLEYTVRKFPPTSYDLILSSVLTPTYEDTCRIVEEYKKLNNNIYSVVGGIHASIMPDEVIRKDCFDAVCVGEGEEALLELVSKYETGENFHDCRNFYFKNGKNDIIVNPLRPHLNLDALPAIDYSLFEEAHFDFHFTGSSYRTVAVELNRGCPFKCSYCVNNFLSGLYSGISPHTRFRSLDLSIQRLVEIKEKYNVTFIRFIDESFSIMTYKQLQRFSDLYAEKVGLPFWVQSAASTLQDERVIQCLKNMNCAAVTIGVEHGDEHFRKTMLRKNQSDKMIFNAMELLQKYDIRRSAYFMIGLPDETRELAFKTISMYRKLIEDYGAAPSSIQCFYPFPGSQLYDYCKEKGYIDPEMNPKNAIAEPALNMPNFSSNEIRGLKRTFFAYAVVDKKYYPLIESCEKESPIADEILEKISAIHSA